MDSILMSDLYSWVSSTGYFFLWICVIDIDIIDTSDNVSKNESVTLLKPTQILPFTQTTPPPLTSFQQTNCNPPNSTPTLPISKYLPIDFNILCINVKKKFLLQKVIPHPLRNQYISCNQST